LPQVTADDLKYSNGDGEVSESNEEPEDHFDADYTEDMPTTLGDTVDQEHEGTSGLCLTGMPNAMADREQEQLEQKENDGEMHG
jgi:hypothetical protein